MISETVAAVDLGSNSFRLQVGRVVDDQIYVLDSLKEPVRLASGLTADKRLDSAAQARALNALRLFGERLGGLDKGAVRAVATNTLRVAKNSLAFLATRRVLPKTPASFCRRPRRRSVFPSKSSPAVKKRA